MPGSRTGESKEIGPADNNMIVGLEVKLLEDTGTALREHTAQWIHPVLAETWETGFYLRFRGGAEACLMLSALRKALNQLDLKEDWTQEDLNKPDGEKLLRPIILSFGGSK